MSENDTIKTIDQRTEDEKKRLKDLEGMQNLN